ncbi:type II toxin-antitoxin system VapC family toxin [Phenylobacterium kunshanense]|uniref:Ribonuclease VapC n=1 Tax=Phenylobacterium kunshanense TaxID=1445034 RepID=A0A328B7H8_9CAUL|nr:type II toxin-antitoxin system VapC family toxin [Phenylobacterium kunshanense]RAK63342.1 type II toxin-antitoxin system VapC family toxin [Phenylobacterium kunshanense]
MICLDSSALLAIAMGEPGWERCMDAIHAERELIMSAGTLTEVLIVAARRGLEEEVEALLTGLNPQVVALARDSATAAAAAYRRWGKGLHPAGLNYGDCFAYEAAQRHGCPLLYVGDDFSKTDVVSAL